MSIGALAQYLDIGLSVLLVVRLVWLRLVSHYRVFLALILFDVLTSLVAQFVPWARLHWDYRLAWLSWRPIAWILYIWVVLSALQRVAAAHKGILSMSRKVFAACFAVSALLGLLSARIEFAVAKPNLPVEIAFIVDRAFCTVSLLLLCATLIYLLWFPVAITRNTALLCSGLMVYFGVKTSLMLVRDIWSPGSFRLVTLVLALVYTACLTLWILFFSEAGERETVRPGHSWQPREQDRLLNQLEAINAVLLRSAKQ